MSIPLPTVNLAGSVVGTTGKISLNNVGISAGGPSADPSLFQNRAHLLIYNESGFGLLFSFPGGGTGIYAPAGAWFPLEIPPGQSELDYSVLYILSSAQVSLLLVTYFAPGESIRVAQIGNSPIAGGGVTSTVGTLSNEGNSPGTEVIDIGTVTNAKLIDIFNDHFVWSVEQNGTAHQILKGQTTGTPLQIGKSGDATEFLGNPVLQNNTALQSKDSGGTARDVFIVDGGNKTIIKGVTGGDEIHFVLSSSADIAKINSSGINLLSGSIVFPSATSLSRLNGGFNTCGSGTVISHGLGVSPTWIAAVPDLAQPGSATVGIGSHGSTTFTATVGAGSNIGWVAGVS